MLKIDSRSLSISATSFIGAEAVASLHASYSGGAEIYTNMNIVNIDLYNANKVIVDADFADFCENVMTMVIAAGMDAEEIVDNTGKE